MLLMIDNFDSFTYNLVQYFAVLGENVKVVRNDEVSISAIERLQPQRIVISPGPGSPNEAGISLEAIKHFAGKLPMLGVCLGHQCIAQAFGGRIVHANQLMHGKTSAIAHDYSGVFHDLPQPFIATRYHSLIVETPSLPNCLQVNAWTSLSAPAGASPVEIPVEIPLEIMAIQHTRWPIVGVQFHPESILTSCGAQLLRNFLAIPLQ
ncbi:MAG: aminodeoxychorismate/anthranilate synthase component II [Gammaproteobacteria bacterium]|nr:aminodeoxychorismate/anthranilate synthase component II [Gammaproteobacteria bacterium]